MKTFDPVADIEEFHTKFGLAYKGKPRVLPAHLDEFRRKFMREELSEYHRAVIATKAAMKERVLLPGDEIAYELQHALDALVDLVYVALGTAHLHGFDFREAWKRVHYANMQKVRAASRADSKRGSRQDVVKPAGWQAPRLHDLVADHAHS